MPFTADLAATETPDIAALSADTVRFVALASSERPDRAEILVSPYWPVHLPRPTLQGYAINPAVAVKRVAVEFGAPRVYRQSKRPLAEVSVVWELDDWQQMLLDGFYHSVVEEGGQWFGVDLSFPSGMAVVSARFMEKLSFKALGGPRWRVTGMLEILSRPVMSDAALTVLLGDEGDAPVWPETLLPSPTVDSWSLEPKSVVARSDNLPGLSRQRRRSRNATTEAQAGWELDADQAEIFDAFFRWRGKDGAQWFSMPVYAGIGTLATDVRFLGEINWLPRGGGRWSVNAPIEIRERAILAAAETVALVPES